MSGTSTCHNCGQANAGGTEYCVRCGERLPDPSSTQLVSTGAGEQEYPWEPPAEWDPGELPPSSGVPAPPPTWVGRGADAQSVPSQGWNAGSQPGAGWAGQPSHPSQPGQTPPPYPPTYGATPPPGGAQQGASGGSKRPWLIAGGVVVLIAAIVVGVLLATGGKKKSNGGSSAAGLNGVQNQSGQDALTSARLAFRGAKSVHLAGDVTSSGQKIRLDLVLAGDNSQGTLTINGNDVQLIKVGSDVYIKGDPDFLKQYAGNNPAVLDQLNGKWLKTSATGDFQNFTQDGFANELKGTNGKVNPKVTQSTLNGQQVVVISQDTGGTLTVANTGPAYPLLLVGKGADSGQLTFTDYNKAVSIISPSSIDVFDVSGTTATLPGSYTCTPNGSTTGGGTLTLSADSSYTVTGGTGGSWGSSGDQVAFSGGTLDKYGATWDKQKTLDLHGSGSNANVSYTCVKQ